MKILFILSLMTLAASAMAQVSYVPSTMLLKKKGQQFYLGGNTFTSSKSINQDGEKFSYEDGESFNRYQVEAGGQYGAADDLQLGLGGRFRQNRSLIKSGDQELEGTSSGVESLLATITYGFKPINQYHWAAEGAFRYRPFTNKEYKSGDSMEDIILGDDGNEYSAGLAMSYAFKSGDYLTLRGGYRSPGDDLADEVYWQVEGAVVWKYFAFIAGVDGIQSMGNDPYGDNPDKRPVYNTGKTALYNSVKRELMAPYLGLHIALGKQWRVEFRGSQVVSGKSTDLGTALGFQIFRRIDKDPAQRLDSQFKSYDIEATISKVSPAKNYVVIDKGMGDDIKKGMAFDFYEFDYVGGNVLIARGTVVQVKSDSAIIKITNRFNSKSEIKTGIVGRATLR